MGHKILFFAKWTFVFGVLLCWTFLVVQSVAFGSAQSDFFDRSFNNPIYFQNLDKTERASSREIIDFLFHHEFDVETKMEVIPMDKCSLRTRGGTFSAEGFDSTQSEVSFNLNYLGEGKGKVIAKDGRKRASVNFESEKIVGTDVDGLAFEASGKARINRNEFDVDEMMIEFDKTTNTVDITSDSFSVENSPVTKMKGCLTSEQQFYLIVDEGELEERRTIEEVRDLLDEHPEFLDSYENLDNLFSDYWFLSLPPGIPLVS